MFSQENVYCILLEIPGLGITIIIFIVFKLYKLIHECLYSFWFEYTVLNGFRFIFDRTIAVINY